MTSKILASKTVQAKLKPTLNEREMQRYGRNFKIALVVATLLSLFLSFQ